jgi:aspartyl-tRNA(Asn)/glutamyl-tRNA(Gln) amidotransferase subunit C
MTLSNETVRHVARLSHIALSPAEIEEFAGELSSIIDHVARLQELNTDSVEPTSHVVVLGDVMREDEVEDAWVSDQVLANAPRRGDNLFAVRAIFD